MQIQNTNPPQDTFGDVGAGQAFSDSLGPLIKSQTAGSATRLDNGQTITTFQDTDPVVEIHPNAVVDLNP